MRGSKAHLQGCAAPTGKRPTRYNKETRSLLGQTKNTDLQRKETKTTEGEYNAQDDLTNQIVVGLDVWLVFVLGAITNKHKLEYRTKRKKPKDVNLNVGKKGSRVLRIGASETFPARTAMPVG